MAKRHVTLSACTKDPVTTNGGTTIGAKTFNPLPRRFELQVLAQLALQLNVNSK